ncbi:CARDB domain-containing protein [Chloroflexota bacterium]
MEKDVFRRIGIAILAVLLVLIPSSGRMTLANGIPPIPHAFYGALLTDRDELAPTGVAVEAWVDGGIAGNITTTEDGKYGSATAGEPKLIVQGNIADGTAIQFYIWSYGQRVTATPSEPDKAVFRSGQVTELELKYVPPPPAPATPAPSGGAGPALAEPGVTKLAAIIDSSGVLTTSTNVTSADNKVTLTIEKGTKALTEDKTPLPKITVVKMTEPPAPPADSHVIGLAYDFGPDGATFDPPILLEFTYDLSLIPEGVPEDKLVIAMWDASTENWIVLDSTVDTSTHTITTRVSHFTIFTILAYTSPAAFTVSDLTVTPAATGIGEQVAIGLTIANNGDLRDTYKATLRINNVVEATKEVTLAGGTSQSITFNVSKDTAGTYEIAIDGLSGTFTIKVPPQPGVFTVSSLVVAPAEVEIGETVTIDVLVTNTGDFEHTDVVKLKINGEVIDTKEVTLAGGADQKLTFNVFKDIAGTYEVTINGQSGTFTAKALLQPPPAPPTTNWVLIWIIVGAAVVVSLGLILWLAVFRRRAGKT